MKIQTKPNWKAYHSVWGSLSKLLLVVAMTGIMTQSLGQTPQQPVVNADHSVTFTVKAPGTKKMVLVLQKPL